MRSIPTAAVATLFSLAITAGLGSASANDLLWDGLFADGSRVAGVPIAGWNVPASQPQLGGKPMFDPANPVRWVVRQGLTASPAAAPRQPFVELDCGDRIPGSVEGHVSGVEDWRRATPPHLLVRPLTPIDFPGKPTRASVRVASEFVRRIVLVPRIGPPDLGARPQRAGRAAFREGAPFGWGFGTQASSAMTFSPRPGWRQRSAIR